MQKQFILVKTLSGSHHVLDFNLIESISPNNERNSENNSKITITGSDYNFYSTEKPIEIYKKIQLLLNANSCKCSG